MKKFFLFLILTLFLSGCLTSKNVESIDKSSETELNQNDNEIIIDQNQQEEKPKYSSQKDCEIKTEKKCDFLMCDIPPCPSQSNLG